MFALLNYPRLCGNSRELKGKGYSPKSAEVRFVVAWKGEEDTEETPIVLANYYFEK